MKFLSKFTINKMRRHSVARFKSGRDNLARKKQIIALASGLFVLVFIPAIYLTLRNPGMVEAGWFNDNWLYRTRLSFSNTGSADSNKKVLFNIDTASLITAGKIQADCGDSRFTDINGNMLQYYIDSTGGACNTNSTDYYVLVPTINAGDTVVYHYYGNSGAVNGTESAQFSQATFTPSSGPSGASEEKSPGPVAYWKFDEGYGQTIQDSTEQNNDGTVTNAVWKDEDICKIGKCLYFDGVGDYVTRADDSDLDFSASDSFTVSVWMKHPGISTSADVILAKYESTGVDGGYRLQMESDGNISFGIDDSNAGFVDDKVTSTAGNYDDDTWHLVTGVKNGTTSISLYIDGRLIGTDSSIASTGTLANNDALYVGIDGDGSSNGWNGFIDEVKIYPYARSADEVKLDYAGGSASGTSAVFGASTSSLSNGLVGYWKMDESSWTNDCSTATVTDSSGNGNDGKSCPASTGPIGAGAGKFANGGVFDGSDDYINLGNLDYISTGNNNEFTVSIWIYPTSVSGYQFIFGDEVSANKGVMIQMNSGVVNDYYPLAYRSTGFTPTLNTWTHIVLRQNSSGVDFFVDGELYSHIMDYLHEEKTQNTYIGNWNGTGGRPFNGTLDEVRIYNRALSPAEIRQLYNYAPGPVAYYNFDENTHLVFSQISQSSDDAEEITEATPPGSGATTGDVDLTSSDIEPVDDNDWNGEQYIGLRFQNINIPQGTKIKNAYIEFEVDATAKDVDGTVTIAGEDVDNSTTFTTTSYDISGRTRTSATVNWTLPPSGAVNDKKITVNIAPIVQEIVNRSGWVSGNSLSIIFLPGVGTREYESYDGEAGAAATLMINTAINDSTGNGNVGYMTSGASMTESQWVPGKFGSALEFDGVNDYVEIPDSDTFSFGDSTKDTPFSISTWVYFTDATSQDIINKIPSTGTTNFEWGLYTFSDDTLNLELYDSSDSVSLNAYTTGTLTSYQNQWVHLETTYDGSSTVGGIKIYINGIEQPLTVATNGVYVAMENTTSPVRISSWLPDLMYANITVDDLKIYDYVRTPKQVIEDMNGGHPIGGSPIGSQAGYWKFDEGYGTTAHDESLNSNDLTLSSASWTTSGKFGMGWNGTGTLWLSRADDVDFDFSASDDFAISGWFKSDSATNPASTEYLVNKASAIIAGYAVYVNTSGQLCFGIDDDTTWGPDVFSCSTDDVYDGTWHSFVAVRDYAGADKTLLYLDGVSVDSDTDSTTGTLANSLSFYVGDRDGTDNGDEFNGDIDELKVYRSILTVDQVKMEYNRGKTAVFGSTSTASDGITSDNSFNREFCIPGDTSTCSSPAVYYPFDENTGTATSYDKSGGGYNLTLAKPGGAKETDWVLGKIGSAMDFAGTSHYAYANNVTPTNQNSSYTVEFWFKPNKTITPLTAGTDILFQKVGTSQWYQGSIRIYLNDADGRVQCQFYDGSTYPDAFTTTSTWNADTWYHMTCVFDDTNDTFSAYVNGKMESSTTGVTGNPSQYTGNVEIGGAVNSSTESFDGAIDEVKYYDYARTPAQIAWDYNRGKPIAHWKLDECSGTTAYDSSGNGNNGTITIGATGANTSAGSCSSGTTTEAWNNGTTGKRNASLDFDGTDDYVDVGNIDILDMKLSDWTASAWIKTSASVPQQIVSKDNTYPSTTNQGWFIYLTGNGYLRGVIGDGTTQIVHSEDGITVNDGAWHHVAVIFDRDGNMKRFVDGKPSGTDVSISSFSATSIDYNWLTLIGTRDRTTYDQFFDGQIDDVKIWNYALTAEQVKLEYNAGAVNFEY